MKIIMIIKISHFLLVILLFSCNSQHNQIKEQKTTQIVDKSLDTNIINSAVTEIISSISRVNIDSIPFTFVAYNKYIILPFTADQNWTTGKYEKISEAKAKCFICDVDNELIPKELKEYIGKDFIAYSGNDSSIKVKIKDIKILLQAVPHFATIQEAEQSENPEKTILDFLWRSGALMVVGEIENADNIYPAWAMSLKVNNHKFIKSPENSIVPDETVNRIFKELNWNKKNLLSIKIEFQTKTEKYIFALLNDSTTMCGGDEYYDFQDLYIIRIDENNQIELLENLGEVTYYFALDLFNDEKPEFIFENNRGIIFLIETENKLNEDVKKIDIPYYDCDC